MDKASDLVQVDVINDDGSPIRTDWVERDDLCAKYFLEHNWVRNKNGKGFWCTQCLKDGRLKISMR